MTEAQMEIEVEYRLARWIFANLHQQGVLTDEEYRRCQITAMKTSNSIYKRLDWTFDRDEEEACAKNFKFLYGELLLCGNCGRRYTHRKHHGYSVWQCGSVNIRQGYCHNPFLYDEILKFGLCTATKRLIKEYPESISYSERVFSLIGIEIGKELSISSFSFDDFRDIWKIIDIIEVMPENILMVRFINGRRRSVTLPAYTPVFNNEIKNTTYVGRKISDDSIKAQSKDNTLVDTLGFEQANFCEQCGALVKQPPKMKKKRFCSDKCRMAWWKSHPEQINRKAIYSFECACCHKKFEAYGNNKRKYCCHECYIEDRNRKRRTEQ